MDLVVSPEDFVDRKMHYTINYQYYIDKQVRAVTAPPR